MSFAFYFGKPLHPGKETSEIVPLALSLSNRVHTLAIYLTKIVSSQSTIQNGKLYVELIFIKIDKLGFDDR